MNRKKIEHLITKDTVDALLTALEIISSLPMAEGSLDRANSIASKALDYFYKKDKNIITKDILYKRKHFDHLIDLTNLENSIVQFEHKQSYGLFECITEDDSDYIYWVKYPNGERVGHSPLEKFKIIGKQEKNIQTW